MRRLHAPALFEGFLKLGVPFWGSRNKDYSILVSILGSFFFFWQLPFQDRIRGSSMRELDVPRGTNKIKQGSIKIRRYTREL